MAWQAVTPRVEEEAPSEGRGPTPPWRLLLAGLLAAIVLGLAMALWPGQRPSPGKAEPPTGQAVPPPRTQGTTRTKHTDPSFGGEGGAPGGTKPVRRIRIASDRSKVQWLSDILDVGGSQTVDQMWAGYQALGLHIGRDILDDYLREAKAYQLDLTKTAGGWDRLLQFWAARDPDAALVWAENAGLFDVDGAPDEIVYRMIQSWGRRDPEAALAYARGLGLEERARGVETLADLEAIQARDQNAILNLESLAALPPAEQMQQLGAMMGRVGGISGKAAIDLAAWLREQQGHFDPTVLAGVLPRLVGAMETLPAAERAAFVEDLLALPMNEAALSSFLPTLARFDVERALGVIAELPASFQPFALNRILGAWTVADPDAAVAHVRSIGEPALRSQALYALFQGLGAAYSPPFQGTAPVAVPRETLDWLADLLEGNPPLRQRHARAYSQLLVGSDPLAAMLVVDQSPENLRTSLRLGVLEQWSRQDLAGAISWLNGQAEGPAKETAYDQILPQIARQDPDAAMAWLNQVEDPAAWEKAATRMLGATPPERLGTILRQLATGTLSPSQQGLVAEKAFGLAFNRSGEAAQVIDLLLENQNVARIGGQVDPEAWKQLSPELIGAMERGFGTLTQSISSQSPEQGLRLAESFAHLPLGIKKWEELAGVFRRWVQLTPGAAMSWLEASALGPEQRRALSP